MLPYSKKLPLTSAADRRSISASADREDRTGQNKNKSDMWVFHFELEYRFLGKHIKAPNPSRTEEHHSALDQTYYLLFQLCPQFLAILRQSAMPRKASDL